MRIRRMCCCPSSRRDGLLQAYARNNATYQSGHRQQMEMTYIRQASIWLDCKILMKTVVAVLRRDGAK